MANNQIYRKQEAKKINIDQFIEKYGTYGASSIIRQLISIGRATNGLSTEQDIKLCNQIADDLQKTLNNYKGGKQK